MYSIHTDSAILEQVETLPADALPFYAELLALLQIAPWSGHAYNRERPEANMRTHTFGADGEGMVIYLVLEDQRRVSLLQVLWVG